MKQLFCAEATNSVFYKTRFRFEDRRRRFRSASVIESTGGGTRIHVY